ncbi:MAG: DUF5655 domain-containing protein, partial [Rhodococcus fascians]
RMRHNRDMAWECPKCRRQFARSGQGHECSPAMTIDEYFSTGPERERPIFDALLAHLENLGPVHVEPLSVGVYFKHGETVATMRPMQRWEAVSFSLPRIVKHPLMTRKPISHGGRWFHIVNITEPDDIDEQIRDWLTEAYLLQIAQHERLR